MKNGKGFMSLQSDIIVKFKNQPKLNIVLDKNPTVSLWLDLFKSNYQREFPIFRDQKKYTLDYLNQLALRAKNELGWNCKTNITSVSDTITLHKNLETTLTNGFSAIPAVYDELIHELHFCLHKIEWVDMDPGAKSRHWLQLEWFNNNEFPLDTEFKHSYTIAFGGIKLQNPYVGHTPWQIYIQNDYENVFQTCRFHDLVRPGLYIHTDNLINDFDLEKYVLWWHTHAKDFVDHHGMDKILHYTGHAVIGRVTNLDDLATIVNSKDILELESVDVFTK